MPKFPVITHQAHDAIVAWRGSLAITVQQFLADLKHVIGELPPGRHVLNLCNDRYRFALTFMACIVSKRISLLPSTHTKEMIRQMRETAPDVFCIIDRDGRGDGLGLPVWRYPEKQIDASHDLLVPEVDSEQVVAHVFTSGSTGAPVPHIKRWGSLVRNVRSQCARLEISTKHTILGTVPAQHMYGLESTVLLPLQSGAALHSGHPFYPADICATLASLPRPRVLVTTPFHLRTLLAEQQDVPATDQLLSATAPLSQELAQEAEDRFGSSLFEIYGCTETGQLASRRTTVETTWQTLGTVELFRKADEIWAQGGHIEQPTVLSDLIELCGDVVCSNRFVLKGRDADQVNIAGKRTSLAYLNHQLTSIPDVQDGVFLFGQANSSTTIDRLSALVVAPSHTHATLMQALRARVDPVFLPRPLVFVKALPRNETGKIPSQLAQALLQQIHHNEPP